MPSSIEKRLSMLPRKHLSYLAVGSSAIYLCICDYIGLTQWFSLLPFLLMATKGVDVTPQSGMILSVLWITYILLLVSPTFLVLGRFAILFIYLPILGVVFYKEPHEEATWLFLTIEYIFWDVPLLIWINIISRLGGRALQPFYSPVTPNLSVGSIPLEVDVTFLKNEKIDIVVNMCREYSGPLLEYQKVGIKQIHLPTPDVCEPNFKDVLKGIATIRELSENSKTQLKIFVHCKAGRGRAATFALCYLVSTGIRVEDAIKLLKEKRPVIEAYILHFKVVTEFINKLKLYLNDVDLMIKESLQSE